MLHAIENQPADLDSAVTSFEEYIETINGGDDMSLLSGLMSTKTVQHYFNSGEFTKEEARRHHKNALTTAKAERRFCIQAKNSNLPGHHETALDCINDVINQLDAVNI